MSDASRDRFVVSPTGRWGGAITSRPLPETAPALVGLAEEEREFIAGVWLTQAATERRVGHSFEVVHRALVDLGADPGLVDVAARAVDDEMRHAELCRQMASRYAGRDVKPPAELPFMHPTHPEASSDRVRRALYVVGQCAFNETFASAYLEAAHASASVPLARAALRELLSDEIDHARIGWAFLATVDASLRREIESWLLPLAIGNLRQWRSTVLTPEGAPEAVRGHGVPQRAAIEAALLDAVATLMIPGLERFGFDVTVMKRWHERGAPTDA
jgi:hypothetical protein